MKKKLLILFFIVILGSTFCFPVSAEEGERTFVEERSIANSCCVCKEVDRTVVTRNAPTKIIKSNKPPFLPDEKKIMDEKTCRSYSTGVFGSGINAMLGRHNTVCSIEQNNLCGSTVETVTTIITPTPTTTQPLRSSVVLGIKIPDLSFSTLTIVPNEEGFIYIPWLAEYLEAIYNFILIIVSIIAVVVIIIAGTQIIISAGGPAKTAGYKKITGAVIGLFIAWGSFIILHTINPELTFLQSLKIKLIPREELLGIEILGESISKAEVLALIEETAPEYNLDPCIFKTIIAKESGWKSNRIGHDENVPRKIGAREKFIASGVKYSGETFVSSPELVEKSSIRNDDGYNPNNPPNYGLDPRFTHGGGLGQFTVLVPTGATEVTRCPDGNIGRTIGGKCYTFPEMMDPATSVKLVGELVKQILKGMGIGQEQRSNLSSNNIRTLFFKYAGAGCSARVSQCRKTQEYAKCKSDPSLAEKELPGDCLIWLKETKENCNNPSFINPKGRKTAGEIRNEADHEEDMSGVDGQSTPSSG